MKKIFLFSLGLILAFSSLFISCSDSDDSSCTITAIATEGGNARIEYYSSNTAIMLAGNTVKLIATPKVGYKFLGWFVDSSETPLSTNATYTFIVSQDIVLVARFKMESFIVSVATLGNGFAEILGTHDTQVEFEYGSVVTVSATPASNHEFIGWFVGDSETVVSTRKTYTFVCQDINLVAKFEEELHIEAVDLGLSVKWASCNVGTTRPERCGGYYAWGEIEEKEDYSLSTYKWCNGSCNTMTKYCTDSRYGTVDNKTVLDPEDDVAHVKWGGDWRMPTKAEQDELLNNCTWRWTILNGVNGCNVTGPNGNSIFLPAAGYCSGTSVYGCGDDGEYWLNSLSGSWSGSYACYMSLPYFGGDINVDDGEDCNCNMYLGRSVRPVCE